MTSQRRRLSPGDDYARTLLRGLPDVVSGMFIAALSRDLDGLTPVRG